MAQGVGHISGDRGVRRGVRNEPAVAVDRLLGAVYLAVVIVLVVIAVAGLAGIGNSFAGPLPLAGPAPGF